MMIKNFAHKGLSRFFTKGDYSGIQYDHQKKLKLILGLLNEATDVMDMNFQGSKLHQLKGDKKGCWAVTVNGNWRITFYFKDGDAYVVDYQDYH